MCHLKIRVGSKQCVCSSKEGKDRFNPEEEGRIGDWEGCHGGQLMRWSRQEIWPVMVARDLDLDQESGSDDSATEGLHKQFNRARVLCTQ